MNILIVDDHRILAEGIASLLAKKQGYRIAGILTEGLKVIPFLENELPDLIILDLDLPDTDGIAVAKDVRAKYPMVKVLVLTMHKEPEYFEPLINAGVVGYVNKNIDKNEIFVALDMVQNGGSYFSQEIISEYIRYQNKPAIEKSEAVRITPREKEVLKLVLEGKTTLDICDVLCLSKNTVDSHRKNLLSKLGVKNTAELVRMAIEKKLV
jgi:DNA-binding NarL/FixJ family response regulator